MLPVIAALALGGWLLFGKKSQPKTASANGPSLLAQLTTQLGSPLSTRNWPAPSGRIYRITQWQAGTATVVLALGGGWGNQPTAPDMLWAFSFVPGADDPLVTEIASVLPDATARSDAGQIRSSIVR